MTLPALTSLEEARHWLRDRIEVGATCPCCTQFAKVYRRKLTPATVRVLAQAYRTVGLGEFHLPTLRGIYGGDVAKARYWGLLEPAERSSYWSLTAHGSNFLHGTVAIPTYAEVFDGRCLGLTGPNRSVSDVVGDAFDLSALLHTPGTLLP